MSTASPGLSSLLPAGSSLPTGEGHQVPTGDETRLHAIIAGAGMPLVLTHGGAAVAGPPCLDLLPLADPPRNAYWRRP